MSNTSTFKCPPSMNANDLSIVDKLNIIVNQKVKKGELLAIVFSGDYEMELTAHSDGVVKELFIKEKQILYKNDVMWTIETR